MVAAPARPAVAAAARRPAARSRRPRALPPGSCPRWVFMTVPPGIRPSAARPSRGSRLERRPGRTRIAARDPGLVSGRDRNGALGPRRCRSGSLPDRGCTPLWCSSLTRAVASADTEGQPVPGQPIPGHAARRFVAAPQHRTTAVDHAGPDVASAPSPVSESGAQRRYRPQNASCTTSSAAGWSPSMTYGQPDQPERQCA